MDVVFFEQLLHEEEGPSLDFKRDQYKVAKASDEEKSELLKDILGFANNWRRSDAYILVGVDDVAGGKGSVVGVSEQLQDHSLQQFVNRLTNRPLRFQYEAFSYAGHSVGIIRIEVQERPFYLTRDFGKLRKGQVYVRRGSSTDPTAPATPDEIAQMGRHAAAEQPRPQIDVEFADPEVNERLGESTSWEATDIRLRQGDRLPDYASYSGSDPIRAMLAATGPRTDNVAFYRDLLEYVAFVSLFQPVRLAITNVGSVAATDVRVELEAHQNDGVRVTDYGEAPHAPERTHHSFAHMPTIPGIRSMHRRPGDVEISLLADRIQLEVDCAALQPGRTVWSDKFYVAVAATGTISLKGRIFAATLPEPKDFTLTIDATVSDREVTSDEVVEIANKGEIE